MKLYGIPNCDTIKKAINWLKLNNIEYEFHDFKKSGITHDVLQTWVAKSGWEKLLNKRGTTWKTLSLAEQEKITDASSAVALMMQNPTIIKRPVIEAGKKLIIGFDEKSWQVNFLKKK